MLQKLSVLQGDVRVFSPLLYFSVLNNSVMLGGENNKLGAKKKDALTINDDNLQCVENCP